jgi:hypothetical protein
MFLIHISQSILQDFLFVRIIRAFDKMLECFLLFLAARTALVGCTLVEFDSGKWQAFMDEFDPIVKLIEIICLYHTPM